MNLSRRTFLVSAFALAAMPRRGLALGFGTHPEPRPGITGAAVLTRAQLHEKDAAEVFDIVRGIPQIADGIRCHCGCAERPGFRSLLSCFESDGMAQHCSVCQGAAKLAHRLHRRGRTLQQIREAIDDEYE
jgi:hypothetical protein